MENTKTVKQTAANNAFLANVKRAMNGKVFAATAVIVNQSGTEAGLTYIGRYFRDTVRAGIVEQFRAGTFKP